MIIVAISVIHVILGHGGGGTDAKKQRHGELLSHDLFEHGRRQHYLRRLINGRRQCSAETRCRGRSRRQHSNAFARPSLLLGALPLQLLLPLLLFLLILRMTRGRLDFFSSAPFSVNARGLGTATGSHTLELVAL
jgi:hypothetical protein